MQFTANEFSKAFSSHEPDSQGISTVLGNEIDTRGFREAMIILHVGDMAGGATLDVKLTAAVATGGSFADVAGAVFSQKAQGVDDNKVFVGRVFVDSQRRFWKMSAIVANAAVEFGLEVVLSHPYTPPTDQVETLGFNVEAA